MFVVALFITAPNWKQPRYPLTGEWVHFPWSIQATESYPAIKRKIIDTHNEVDESPDNYADRRKQTILCDSIDIILSK